MFCSDCGKVLIGDAKFCQYCGKKVEYLEEAELLAEENSEKDGIIEDWFSDIMTMSYYGENVCIVEEFIYSSEEEQQLIQEVRRNGGLGSDEELLLILYDRPVSHRIRMIITNRYLIMKSPEANGKTEKVNLLEIKAVKAEKWNDKGFGMRVLMNDNRMSSLVPLVGMDRESAQDFFKDFGLFIEKIKENCANMIDQKEQKRSVQEILKDVCMHHCKESVTYSIGRPYVSKDSRQCENAFNYFKIPGYEELYFIHDDAVFFSCKTGFAFGKAGFYYAKENIGFIPWGSFMDCEIISLDLYGKEHICFYGPFELVTFLFGKDEKRKNMLDVLNKIQHGLRNG